MLMSPLLPPESLRALGSAGHGAKVLIGEGNHPFGTGGSERAVIATGEERVHANVLLTIGVVPPPDRREPA
jgi:L-fucose mutarotase/ribose pyranase (RbsD/FucU family)